MGQYVQPAHQMTSQMFRSQNARNDVEIVLYMKYYALFLIPTETNTYSDFI